jgi:membrane fusion protein (multidrug efflux system)
MHGPATVDSSLPDLEEPPAQRPSPLESKRVKTALAIVVLTVLIVLGVLLVHWWTVGRFVQSTNDAFLQADQVAVASKEAGYVEQVLVADNQEVSAGQPLVRIDPRDAQAKLAQAEALVGQGRASILQAEAQLRQQEAAVAQAQAQLSGYRASAAFATREVDRYGPLVRSGAETAERLDQLRQSRDQANAQATAAIASLLAAERQVDTLRAQIQVAQATTEQAAAQARQAHNTVDDAVVRASIAGRIGDRTVRTGQYIQPGTRLMTVVPVQSIYLVANFKETQLGRMRPGQPVEIKVDALGDRKLKGVVESFSPGTAAQFALIPPNNATGNFTKIVQRVPVRIRIIAPTNVRPALLPGLSAEVAVDTLNLDTSVRPTGQNGDGVR